MLLRDVPAGRYDLEVVGIEDRLEQLRRAATASVDIGWLAAFRIGLGLMMAWTAYEYLARGWVDDNWIEPRYHFSYGGFEWVKPWTGLGMRTEFAAMVGLGLAFAVGIGFRVVAPLLFLCHAHVFLIDRACYQNHSYLFCLLILLVGTLPAHACWSVDRAVGFATPREHVPAWMLWMIRFQVGVPYLYGGIAKLNPDWLRGDPLRQWLPSRTDFPVVGSWIGTEAGVYALSYSGLVLDLVAVPLLLVRRTRVWAFAALFAFHLANSRLFHIGVFPWVMVVATCVFLDPGAPRDVVERVCGAAKRLRIDGVVSVLALGAVLGTLAALWMSRWDDPPVWLAGAVGGTAMAWLLTRSRTVGSAEGHAATSRSLRPVLVGALVLWMSIQLLVPLRHLVIPGRVAWTTEGELFSWHMKLNDRDGTMRFRVVGERGEVEVEPRAVLPRWQVNRIDGRAHLIRQFAEILSDRYPERAGVDAAVYADVFVALNGGPPTRLIDPAVDLAHAPVPWFGRAPWILSEPQRGEAVPQGVESAGPGGIRDHAAPPRNR